ncbi:MAG: YfiR family protein [Sedimentisphaerales bacterium]|nr:YfiR family protein [Sedimentisphaerales bacterium]
MKLKSNSTVLLLAVIALICAAAAAHAEPDSQQEYQIKAAFLYNFLKFVDWPEDEKADANNPIILAILGKDPFEKAFDPVKDKLVKGRKVVVKRLSSIAELKKLGETAKARIDKQIDAPKKCNLLFVCRSEKDALKDILKAVAHQPVLTVSDIDGFIETGGIINFVTDEQKVRFEVSTAAAKNAKLKVRSQLLRLAKKVIK